MWLKKHKKIIIIFLSSLISLISLSLLPLLCLSTLQSASIHNILPSNFLNHISVSLFKLVYHLIEGFLLRKFPTNYLVLSASGWYVVYWGGSGWIRKTRCCISWCLFLPKMLIPQEVYLICFWVTFPFNFHCMVCLIWSFTSLTFLDLIYYWFVHFKVINECERQTKQDEFTWPFFLLWSLNSD